MAVAYPQVTAILFTRVTEALPSCYCALEESPSRARTVHGGCSSGSEILKCKECSAVRDESEAPVGHPSKKRCSKVYRGLNECLFCDIIAIIAIAAWCLNVEFVQILSLF